jgi:hypothetical protein
LYFSIKNGKYTIIILYVDDIIMIGDDTETIDQVKGTMMHTFRMTDLGDAQYYLGMELKYTDHSIYFHQQGYFEKLLNRFGMLNCTPLSVPINSRSRLSKKFGSTPIDVKTYQSLVGGLLHAIISRWDI